MLVYKPNKVQNNKLALNCLTKFEMIYLKFSLTSQCHKTTIYI